MTDSVPQTEIDRLLVRLIGRLAVAVTVMLALFDVAMLRSWPFPDALDVIRGPIYVFVAVLLVAATLAITFIGYRVVTMRIVRRARSVYLIFLPAVFLFSTIIGFLILTAPR